jgi:peptidyl-prolyl cis-trans isomerase B (cyclophilin B)
MRNKQYATILVAALIIVGCNPRIAEGLRKNDLKKYVELTTSEGVIVLRLSDSTPLHRNNFIKLVKQHFYDSIQFHRVIKNFMIQAGDPRTKRKFEGPLPPKDSLNYSIPAEIRSTLFHKKGVLAAARLSDDVNPSKASSASQFYIVQGRIFTDTGLDSVETFRLKGRKIPLPEREVYKTIGGAPHLDQSYTVFGEVVSGLPVVDSIANTPTTGRQSGDKPLGDVRIIRARLIKR